MFNKYSLADLFANIYKKLKINLLLIGIIFSTLAIPLVYKTISNSSVVVTSTESFSSYVAYKIDAPKNGNTIIKETDSGYSDFYAKTIKSNINGAYFFNGVSEEKMSALASSYGVGVETLKNSNLEFWEKKIEVNTIQENLGVSVKIFTPSQEVNRIIEEKIDAVVNSYKNTFDNTTVTKLETVYSKDSKTDSQEMSSYSKKALALKLIIVVIISIFFVSGANFVMYIFNPTINRKGDYSSYSLNFVQDISNDTQLKETVEYLKNKYSNYNIGIVSSIKSINEKLKKLNYTVVDIDNISEILENDKLIFVEEYGITRYKNFEINKSVVDNFEKEVIGIISYKL